MMNKIFGMKEMASLILFVFTTGTDDLKRSSSALINLRRHKFASTGWFDMSGDFVSPFLDGEVPSAIWGIKNIKKLDLSFRNLTELSSRIGELTELEELNLNSNKLTRLPPLESLKKLRKLSIENNLFEVLPPEIGQLENLEDLNICGNKIRELPCFLSKMRSLKRVEILENPLVKVDCCILKMDPLPEFKIGLIDVYNDTGKKVCNSFINFAEEYERIQRNRQDDLKLEKIVNPTSTFKKPINEEELVNSKEEQDRISKRF